MRSGCALLTKFRQHSRLQGRSEVDIAMPSFNTGVWSILVLCGSMAS